MIGMDEGYINGSEIISSKKHECFEVLLNNKFEIYYKFPDGSLPDNKLIHIRVYDGKNIIGTADPIETNVDIMPQNIQVDEKYRRRGIANAMYVFVEKLTGKIFQDQGDENRTEAAIKFWNQPKRPFGNQE